MNPTKFFMTRYSSAIYLILTLVYPNIAFAYEEWEQKIIEAGCLDYELKPVNSEYLRCMKEQIKATGSGREKFTKEKITGDYVYACGEDGSYRSCEIGLLNSKGFSILSISIERNTGKPIEQSFYPSVTLNSFALGDTCNCEVDEWTLESENSIFRGWGLWMDKEAVPVIQLINSATKLSIYASSPSSKRNNYRSAINEKTLINYQKALNTIIESMH